jgi:hypothetical protein
VEDTYFIGEYSETSTTSEDGYRESTLMLTGTTIGSWMDLEQHRANIEHHFPRIHGLRLTTDTGTVVIFYENSFPVPTGEADLKRIQINLLVKEWRNEQWV